MVSPRFTRPPVPPYGVAEQLNPIVQRVTAPNSGPFTFHGTGTYLLGKKKVMVIDPGPNDPNHTTALRIAIGDREVTHILTTHHHMDHCQYALSLSIITGAATYGFSLNTADINGFADSGEEGVDVSYSPEINLGEGDIVDNGEVAISCIHTPGHTSDHLCYCLDTKKTLFCGDHVMGWSTSVISPPNGNLQSYLHSLRKLLPRDDNVYLPTHGEAIDNPQTFVRQLIAHREKRLEQVVEHLGSEPASALELSRRIYKNLNPALEKASARSTLASLEYLEAREVARSTEGVGILRKFVLNRSRYREA